MNSETPHLQFQYAGNRGGDYFADHCKVAHKHEAQATWNSPQGPGRYRIWNKPGDRYGGNHHYEVVRLKPSTGALKFSGRALGRVRSFAEAVALAEADNARLAQDRAT